MAEPEAPSVEETLTPDDAVDLTRDLLPTGVRSRALGLKLGLSKAVVYDIHRNFSEPQDSLFHVLVESTSQPGSRLTWTVFADALRSCEVNLPALADRVEATYNIKSDGKEPISTSPDVPDDEVVKSKPVAESSSPIEALEDRMKGLQQRFRSIRKSTIHCLVKCQVAIVTVVSLVTSILGFDVRKAFQEKRQKDLHQCKDHWELFGYLNFYWNFLSFNLLQQLLNKHALKDCLDLKHEMVVYADDVERFGQDTTLLLFCRVASDKCLLIPPGFQRMVTEHTLPETATLQDLEEFQKSFLNTFGLNDCAMMLEGVEMGSFKVTWFTRLHTTVIQHMKGSRGRIKTFRDFKVAFVSIDGECIFRIQEMEQPPTTGEPTTESPTTTSEATSKDPILEEVVKENNEPIITRVVVMSCVHQSSRYIDWRILSRQFKRHNVKIPVLNTLFGVTSHFNYGSLELQLVLVRELSHIPDGFQIFYNCLRDTQDICREHRIFADDLEMESRRRHRHTSTSKTTTKSSIPTTSETTTKSSIPTTSEATAKDPSLEKIAKEDDEPIITREVVMSCVDHSLGYVDQTILSQPLERYGVKSHLFRKLFFHSLERRLYFKYDSHEVKLLVEELREIKNGFQIFYNCLRDTQDRCHGHLILADDLELESRGIKKDDLCITKDVIFSALCKTNGNLNVHVLRAQLKRHRVDKNHTLLLEHLRRMPYDFDGKFMYYAFHQLQKVDEAFPKIFYLCLRETQDVFHKHQMVADDLKWEARRKQGFISQTKHTPVPSTTTETSQGPGTTSSSLPETKAVLTLELLTKDDEEPHITEAACLCSARLIGHRVDFEVLEAQFEKYGIIEANLLGSIHDMKWKFMRETYMVHIRELLESLDEVENGFQIFYRCLRETQDGCKKHAHVVNDLEFTARRMYSNTELQSASAGSIKQQQSKLSSSVLSEESVVYNGEELSYHSRTGISLNIPAAECKKPVDISIQVVNDNYSLPLRYRKMPIVSDIYRITTSAAIPAPVTVRMQHCAVVEDSHSLVHIVAHGSPPYRFKLLYGGTFPVGESYGEIKLRRFCILATLAHKLGLKKSLLLSWQMFYHEDNTASFVATKNTPSLIQARQKEYPDAIAERSKLMVCHYNTKAITLNIPLEPQAGWKILPTFKPPRILTRLIQQYRPGDTPPAVELKLKWTGEGEPKEEDVEIGVEGCSIESFTLSCKPFRMHTAQHPIGHQPASFQPPEQPTSPPSLQSTTSSDTSQSHTPPPPLEPERNKLEKVVSEEDIITIARCIDDWEALAFYLGFTDPEKNHIRDSFPSDVEKQARKCLQKWKTAKGREATYQALIIAAERAKDQHLADCIRDM